MLTNPYLIALGIPIILLFSGAFAKKLVRGTSWQRSDFYLGVELALAAMASALVFVFDLVQLDKNNNLPNEFVAQKMAGNASFFSSLFFFIIMDFNYSPRLGKTLPKPKRSINLAWYNC